MELELDNFDFRYEIRFRPNEEVLFSLTTIECQGRQLGHTSGEYVHKWFKDSLLMFWACEEDKLRNSSDQALLVISLKKVNSSRTQNVQFERLFEFSSKTFNEELLAAVDWRRIDQNSVLDEHNFFPGDCGSDPQMEGRFRPIVVLVFPLTSLGILILCGIRQWILNMSRGDR